MQEAQLKAEIAKLMALAETADNQPIPDGMDIPAELARRGARLNAIAIAKIKIEERAQQRFDVEQADHADEMAKRAKKAAQSGKPPRGKPPTAPKAEEAVHRAATAQRRCNTVGSHAPYVTDDGRARTLWATQMHRRTGDRHH